MGVSSYTSLPANDPNALINAVAKQPIAIAMASGALYAYKSGVFDNPRCGSNINHALTLVGYGNDAASGKDYWLVKNSWGASWGEQGYIKVKRDSNNGVGMCGILKLNSYPTL